MASGEPDASANTLQQAPTSILGEFDPTVVEVLYRNDLPPRTAQNLQPARPTPRAAERPNAILRENRSYEPLTDEIAAAYGWTIRQQVYVGELNFASFNVPAGTDHQALANLDRDFGDEVAQAGFAPLSYACWEPDDPDYAGSTDSGGPQWSHRRIGCSQAWDYTRGSTVRVAVVDTGVRLTHEELAAQVLDPQVAFPGEQLDVLHDDNTVEDLAGHGTFIAGVIAAEGNNARTIIGVAPECEVIPIKIADNLSAMTGDILAGCLLAKQLGAKVVNLSWGREAYYLPEKQMVKELYDAGVLLVGSAGNDNHTAPIYPGAYANALSVGATDADDERCPTCNYGDWLDLAAPGIWLKGCRYTADDDYEEWGWGTSFSAPFVVGGAALLWATEPTLGVEEVMGLLTCSGAATEGFGAAAEVPRLDLDGAFKLLSGAWLEPSRLTRLASGGTVTLAPLLLPASATDNVNELSAYFDGELVGTSTSPPFSFMFDTGAVTFGIAEVQFDARCGAAWTQIAFPLLVDNTPGLPVVTEGFEQPQCLFAPLALNHYAFPLIEALKRPPLVEGEWEENDVRLNGPARWYVFTEDAAEGAACMYLGSAAGDYGCFELDALVSCRVDLSIAPQPTLTFYHRYNLEDLGYAYDQARVLVTADYGQSFSLATLRSGADACFTGFEPAWTLAEVDLSAFAGQFVHLVLLFESDALGCGEEEGQPAGWWVDQLAVSGNYATALPPLAEVSLSPGPVVGTVPAATKLQVAAPDASGLASVHYRLNVAPFNVLDAQDVDVTSAASPFSASIPIPDCPNQQAQLLAYGVSTTGAPAPALSTPVWIFNQLGDTNADGTVDQADHDGFAAMIGLTSADAEYLPCFDSNCDGVIDERDAAAVGYFWGDES